MVMAIVELGVEGLKKGEMYVGLGKGRALHITPDGKVESIGLGRTLPDFAYLMFPLVMRVVPSEFESMGGFADIVAMEEILGSRPDGPEVIYKKTGPRLAAAAVPARRLASVFMELSPIKIMLDTNQMSKDAYKSRRLKLEGIIKEYYPGSKKSVEERENPLRKIKPSTGKYKSRDGISF